MTAAPRIEAIAPNLKRRLSGVTATIARLVPIQARSIGIVATGPGLPPDVPHLPLWRVALLDRGPRVWHARRNTEMLMGLALRHLLGKRWKLAFTSASQRRHSRYTRWLIRRMDAVIATSNKTARYLEGPAVVIRHGIDTETFRPAGTRAEARARLGLPGDGALIGCFGRIRAQKGTDLFVEAMITALPHLPGARAVVMGRATGPHQGFLDDLRRRTAGAGLAQRLLFLPEAPVHEMARWYQALDLFVAPQRWEGFGLTPLEAMACGVPVIASDVGAFSELVANGVTGVLAPPDDAAALARAARDILGDPPRRDLWAAAARAHVVDNFRIEDEAAAINRVYRGLLSG